MRYRVTFDDHKFMRLAIAKARQGIRRGQTPFGACLVKDGRVVSCAHNSVWGGWDITAHAELNAIRQACRKLRTIDLSGCTVYSTCEPCPMCFSACHWARVSRIVYGATIKDARRVGFNELGISNHKMKSAGQSSIVVIGSVLRDETLALFSQWTRRRDKRVY